MKIIIANTDIHALLKTTNNILSKYGRDEVPEKIKGQATLSVLKKLFEGNHFSICEVKNMEKLNHVKISSEHINFMHTLHCVDFKDMTEDVREYLFALLVDYFKTNLVMANASYGETND